MPEWVGNASLILALILSAFNLWDKIDAKKKAAKEPTKLLESRIGNLEQLMNIELKRKLTEYEGHFERDLRRIETMEEGNKVTQQVLLALVSHALDGNDVEALRDAKKKLENYLINR